MLKNKYQLNEVERQQEELTRRRRRKRSKRYIRLVLIGVAVVGMALLAAPSIISQTGIARSYLRSAAEANGWQAQAESITVGWITPLSIRNLDLLGGSGETRLSVNQIDSSITIIDLIRFDTVNVDELTLRGVAMECTVSAGSSSIEQDLAPFFETESDRSPSFATTVVVQDVTISAKDAATGNTWVVDQSNLKVTLDEESIAAEIEGVAHGPQGDDGALSGTLEHLFAVDDVAGQQVHSMDGPEANPADTLKLKWQLAIQVESFPLSTFNLASRRFSNSIDQLPEKVAGDASGEIRVIGATDGSIRAAVKNVRVRNLQATAAAANQHGNVVSKNWSNALATIDGELSLSDGWLIGYGLSGTTDFASLTIDGAFPTKITLTGTNDNPFSWLQSLDGRAEVELDLPAFNEALPGLIPLRDDAVLVSGIVRGTIENNLPTPVANPLAANHSAAGSSTAVRTSQLTLTSESVRARASGRPVVIEPIRLEATVSNDQGRVQADHFLLESSFADAIGQGSLKSGNADVQIDFGRLYAMLRPLVDMSEFSLGGTAQGKVNWKADSVTHAGFQRWELGGQGEGNQLMVTLPDGTRFTRPAVVGNLSAVGDWDGSTLKQITAANVSIHSGGVVASAELIRPVASPTTATSFPIRLAGDGRLENLSESLKPWIPSWIHGAEGRMNWTGEVEVGKSRVLLSKADIDLTQPRVALANQWLSQPSLKIDFDGVLDWPSGNFFSQNMTVVGEAVSVAVRGEASRENTQLDVAWKTDLGRLQSSVGSRIATAKTNLRSVSFRPVRGSEYQFSGRSEGTMTIRGGPETWSIETDASGSSLAIYAPTGTEIIPPGTPVGGQGGGRQPSFGASFQNRNANLPRTNRVEAIWSEPRLAVRGVSQYHARSGGLKFDGVQVATDWFAGTLSGQLQQDETSTQLKLSGPSRWKIDEIANRLSAFTGARIVASGVHETPLEIQWRSSDTQSFQLDVTGNLGWDSVELAGVRAGTTQIPFRLTESSLKLASATVPIEPSSVGGSIGYPGTARLSGQIDFGSNPILRIDPGSQIESLHVTPQIAASWLKYAAPLVAGATEVEGKFGADLDEATIVLNDLMASTVHGSLNIERIALSSGPLANQLILGVQQLKSLTRFTGGEFAGPVAKTLIQMPPQKVDFSVRDGAVTHQRMFFQIDRAQVITSGRVDRDTRIDLVAQVPLDARWLGSDLQGMAGESIALPITGTLSHPSLNPSGVREVMTRLGTRAGQEVINKRLDNVIQEQIGIGIDQINNGLEKIFQLP